MGTLFVPTRIASVGWAKRSVPTTHRNRVGTLRFAHPTKSSLQKAKKRVFSVEEERNMLKSGARNPAEIVV